MSLLFLLRGETQSVPGAPTNLVVTHVPLPKTSTLVDPLNDFSKFDNPIGSIVNGALRLTAPTGSAATYRQGLYSSAWDLSDSSIATRGDARTLTTASTESALAIESTLTPDNRVIIGYGPGNASLIFQKYEQGTLTGIYPAVPVGDRAGRVAIRVTHSAGTLTFDSSTDGTTWTTATTMSLNWVPNSVRIRLQVGHWDSTQTVGSGEYVDWFGVNTDLVAAAAVQSLAPAATASAEAVGTAVVTRGAVTVTPAAVDDDTIIGTATVTRGAVTLSPAGIASVEAVGTSTVTRGAVTVSPAATLDIHPAGTPTLTPATVTLGVTSADDTSATGAPTLSSGAVTVSPPALTSTEAVGTPTVTATAAPPGTLLWSDDFTSLDIVTPATPNARWRANDTWQGHVGYKDFAGESWNLNPNQSLGGAPRSAFAITADGLRISAIRTPEAWKADIVATMGAGSTAPTWSGGILISNTAVAANRFTYGYFEFRARYPTQGRGMFPALWMFGANGQNPGKERSEIDLFEVFGDPDGSPWSITLHEKKDPDGTAATGATTGNGQVNIATTEGDTAGWHTYAVDWQSTHLRFYKDNVLVAQAPAGDVTYFQGVSMAVRLNYAVDAPFFASQNRSDGTTPDPLVSEIDYVKVYNSKPMVDAPVVIPAAVPSAEAVGTSAVSRGVVNLAPDAVGSAEAVGTASLTAGQVTVAPTAVGSLEAFGTAVVTRGAVTVSPTAVGSLEATGTPALTVGTTTVSATAAASAFTAGTPIVAVAGQVQLVPAGTVSAEQVGTATLARGQVQVTASAAPSAFTSGSLTVTVGQVTVDPSGAATSAVAGVPVVSVGGTSIAVPESLDTSAIGTPNVAGGPASLELVAVSSAELVGMAEVQAGGVLLEVLGIPTSGQVGLPTVGYRSALPKVLRPGTSVVDVPLLGTATLILPPTAKADVYAPPAGQAVVAATQTGSALVTAAQTGQALVDVPPSGKAELDAQLVGASTIGYE